MHELSYVLDIIDAAKEIYNKENNVNIKKIVVDVGEMSGVLPQYLQKYFQECQKNTFLEDTVLVTNEKKVIFLCDNCKKEYKPVKEYNYCCPICNSGKGKLIQGKGVIIKEIVVEDV